MLHIFKKIFIFAVGIVANVAVMACEQALPYDTPEFCESFRNVARCHCTENGLPSRLCQNVDTIYSRMISTFGSIERACKFQKDTSQQSCIDAWNCYLKGGTFANGRLCSATGIPCVH